MSDNKKKGLGRSFASLIPDDVLEEAFDPTADQDGKISDLRMVKVDDVYVDPDQPRKHFDDVSLAELAASLREHGLIQPLVVVPRRDGGYMVVAGERRYRAAKLAGIERLPVLIRTLTAQHKLEVSIIENVQRRDLTAIEIATAYAKLRDQFNLTVDQIGARVGGKSVSAIKNTLRLLKLPRDAKEAIADGRLSEGQARPLIGADETLVSELLPRIIEERWSARQVEAAMADVRDGKSIKKKIPHPKVTKIDTSRVEKVLGTPVRVFVSAKGSGSITLRFRDSDQRDQLLERLSQ